MTFRVVNYGGGTNSTALLIEAANRRIPVDLIAFADTGSEKPPTYEYVDLFSAWLENRGYPAITRTKWIRQDGTFLSIEDVCRRDRQLPSKAYGYAGCTTKWKQQPVDKLVYGHAATAAAWAIDEAIERWIGYDADEPSRAKRMLDKNPQPRGGAVVWRAPLVEWDMGRDECIAVIEAAGLPLPGKSSCFMCPSMKKPEIDQLGIDHPELLDRALAIEDEARPGLQGGIKGLGRNFSWREYVEREAAACAARETVDADCGCYDGE